MKNAPSMKDYLNEESKEYFETVLSLLDELNIPYEIRDKIKYKFKGNIKSTNNKSTINKKI